MIFTGYHILADITLTFKVIGLAIFLTIWLLVVLRLLLTRSSSYQKAARIPLDDQQVVEPRPRPAVSSPVHDEDYIDG